MTAICVFPLSRADKMAPFLFAISICIIRTISPVLALRPTVPPLIKGHPFIAIWHSTTPVCQKNEIPLNLEAFQAVTTPAAMPHQFLNIFYEPRPGLYPEIHTETQESIWGGIPQNASLSKHLMEAEKDIKHLISDKFPGLAVVDWEAWRPLWSRNWGSKVIYRKFSIAHAKKLNPSLPSDKIEELARFQFEQEGRNFMEKTLRLGLGLRPNYLWGYYLFPDCYNHKWSEPGYTGKCSDKTKAQNNELMWLWNCSTALFPSIYISEDLRNSPNAKLYVRNRVQESLRVSELSKHPYMVPTYVYSRILYRTKNDKFLTTVGRRDHLK